MSEEKEKDLYPENFGRPPHFNTPKELEEKLAQYFNEEAMQVVDKVMNEDGDFEDVTVFKPTITGLSIYLGFCSKQSFYDYEKRKGFSYPIKKARTLIEQYYESKLTNQNVTGIIFALKNFGWADKQEIDHKNNGKSFDRPKIIFTKTEKGRTHDQSSESEQ